MHPQPAGDVLTEASRRRTFAVISHPDAGKSTLTEAIALHARVIGEAGAVQGKAGRRGVISDWMSMEQARGISITSAALQFSYGDVVVNLVDTPGHADFSEDTYRVLSAVDCAVMLIDAAKGLEPQTLKLFDVCRHSGLPVITFVNKWDRPGRHPLELADELSARIGLQPAPVTWPVGEAGRFSGLIDLHSAPSSQEACVSTFDIAAHGATLAAERALDPAQAAQALGEDYTTALEEVDLLPRLDLDDFLAATTSPLLFGAAVYNTGVRHLLEVLAHLAPPPSPRPDVAGASRALDAPFSGLVFKVQAGMDRAHRDRLAFVRVASGRFERGMVVTHADSGRPFATKYAQAVFGRERETLEEAFPGDVVGLVNASVLRVGDSLHAPEAPVTFPRPPVFAPEHFAVASAADLGRSKQFRKGVAQLEHEGVVQVLRSDIRGDASPVFAAVGPLQFEVAMHRMEHEFNSPIKLDRLPYSLARRTRAQDAAVLGRERGVEVAERGDGAWLAMFTDRWRLDGVKRLHPDVVLEPLVAEGT